MKRDSDKFERHFPNDGKVDPTARSNLWMIKKSVQAGYWILSTLMYLVFMSGASMIVQFDKKFYLVYTVAWFVAEGLLGWILVDCLSTWIRKFEADLVEVRLDMKDDNKVDNKDDSNGK